MVQRKGFGPLIPGVFHAQFPDSYRRPDGITPEDHAVSCVRAIEEELFRTTLPAEEVAAIVVEPIQGEGGYIVPPTAFFEELARLADKHGILLIFDEVQCGMGRTGKMWAADHFGVTPDIFTIAKGIASGMPLSAMMARAEIMNWPARRACLHLRRKSGGGGGVARDHRTAGARADRERGAHRRSHSRSAAQLAANASRMSAMCAAWA